MEPEKKNNNQTCAGFEPITSVISVQYSMKLSYQADWELTTL